MTSNSAIEREIKSAGGYEPFARLVGCSYLTIKNLLSGRYAASQRVCDAIVRATEGRVTEEDVRSLCDRPPSGSGPKAVIDQHWEEDDESARRAWFHTRAVAGAKAARKAVERDAP